MNRRENKRYFQWIAGELQGEVEELESIEKFEDETFYNFKDGESCNLRFISPITNNKGDLKHKFMVEIDSPMNVWSFDVVKTNLYTDQSMKGEAVEIPTLHDILQANSSSSEVHSDIGTQKLVPPRNKQNIRPLPRIEDYPVRTQEKPKQVYQPKKQNIEFEIKDNSVIVDEQTVETPVTNVNEPTQQQEQEQKVVAKETAQNNRSASSDPIRILVDTCKKHETEISLSINLNLPSKTVYNIAADEFDDGGKKFIHYITNDIDVSDIIKAIECALTESYTQEEKKCEEQNVVE